MPEPKARFDLEPGQYAPSWWAGIAVFLAALLFAAFSLVFQPGRDPGARTGASTAATVRDLAPALEAAVQEAATFIEQPQPAPDPVALETADEAVTHPEPPTARSVTPAPVTQPSPPIATPAVDPVERWRVEGIVLVDAGDWDAVSLSVVDQALALLPERIHSQLGNRALGPLTISVNSTGSTPSGGRPYGGPANFYTTNGAHNELVLYRGQGLLTVLHELGHAYNLRRQPAASYATVLLDPEMQGFMAAAGWRILTPATELRALRDQSDPAYAYEGASIWTKLSRNDPLEDFANSFALYFADPDELGRLSPQRLAWFEGNVGR
jgi:hypothetical protein